MDELLSTLYEALAKHKELIDGLTSELNQFEDAYSKDRELIQSQLDDIYVQIDRLVKEAVNRIPKPKDGRDAVIDYNRIYQVLNAKINTLLTSKDKDINEIRADLKSYIIEQFATYKPKDGKDGVDGIGIKGDAGSKGDKGDDGVGIEDIRLSKDTLVFELSNDTEKRVKLPSQKQTMIMGGGGGGGINFDLMQQTSPQFGDWMLIFRDGKTYKVPMSELITFFGGGIPANAVTYNGDLVTYNGDIITY